MELKKKKKGIMSLLVYLPSYGSISLCFISLCRLKGADPSMFQVGTAPQNSCANYFPSGTAAGCVAACTEVVAITIIMLFLGKEWKKMSECLGGFKCSRPLTHANHWEQLEGSTVRSKLFGKPALIFNLVRRQSVFLMKPNKLQVCQFLQKGKAFFSVLD